MPYTTRLASLIVDLNERTATVICRLEDALREEGLLDSQTKPDDEANSHASTQPGQAQKRQDLWWARIIAPIPFVGALTPKERKFGSAQADLDPPADALRSRFIFSLNLVLLQMRKSAKDAETDRTGDPNILVRFILIRFVTLALSQNMDVNHGGDKLISILEHFSESLNSSDVLWPKKLLGKQKPGLVNEFLHNNVSDWLSLARGMVSVTRSLHQNKIAMNYLGRELRESKSMILGHIAAELDPTITKMDMSPEWIPNTLSRLEQRLIETNTGGGTSLAMTIVQPHDQTHVYTTLSTY